MQKAKWAALAAMVACATAVFANGPVTAWAAKRAAAKAGYAMDVERAKLNPMSWAVELEGVKVTGKGKSVVAKEIVAVLDGTKVTGMIIKGAKVEVNSSPEGGEGGRGRRPEIVLEDSTIYVTRGGIEIEAKVKKARLSPDERVWAEADVRAKAGPATVRASGLRADGEEISQETEWRMKELEVDLEEKEVREDTKKEGRTREKRARVFAEKATIRAGGKTIAARNLRASASANEGGDEIMAEAEMIECSGVSAEGVKARARRERERGSVEVRLEAAKLEAGDEKIAKGDLSLEKVLLQGKLVRSDGMIELQDSSIRVSGVKVVLEGYVKPDRIGLRAQMDEVGCGTLLRSLPRGLVPKLMTDTETTEVEGSISWRVELRASYPAWGKPDVSMWLKNKCVVKEVPEELRVQRIRRPFEREVYASDGKRVAETSGPGSKNWVPLTMVSPYMPLAVMATEDPSFMSHRGILLQAIENSMEQNIEARRFVRGGSTISMQLAKNLWLAREKTLSRKVQEAFLTTYLEQRMTKTEMMEYYLNIVELGPNLYGVGPAARRYFSKEPSTLTLTQSLYLASLLPSPRSANYVEGKPVSEGRLKFIHAVMKTMLERGSITRDQYDQGMKEAPTFGEPSVGGEPEHGAIIGQGEGIDPSEWR